MRIVMRMKALIVALLVILMSYGVPWLVASVLAGGSRTAQVSAALAVGLCFLMGAFIAAIQGGRK